MKRPPNGKGSGEYAADSTLTLGTSLALQLRKINHADSARWRAHGEWILERYQRTSDPRDLHALQIHLGAMRQRLAT